ncbi:UNVERIFIED_CONTAM: hypothetical protein FKN15_047692 [Acipenser sinensis]
MEGRHTGHQLHKPIKELSHISLYFPRGRVRRFTYKGSASSQDQPINCFAKYDQAKEEPEGAKQKAQSCESTAKHLNLTTTKGAVTESHRLTTEQERVLTDLFAICAYCRTRFQMGNQDGKLQGYPESGNLWTGDEDGRFSSSSDVQHFQSLSLSTEQKKTASKSRKMKKLGTRKRDSAEGILQSKIKRKVYSGTELSSVCVSKGNDRNIYSKLPASPKDPGVVTCTSMESSATSASEEKDKIEKEDWEYLEHSKNFESDTDLCSELSEYDNELLTGYGVLYGSSFLDEQDNIKLERSMCGYYMDSMSEHSSPGKAVKKSADQTYPYQTACRSTVRLARLLRSLQIRHTLTIMEFTKEKLGLKLLLNCRSYQCMSPAPSPLSSRLPSPQLNHRILPLPRQCTEKEEALPAAGFSIDRVQEPHTQRPTSEVLDKNGNKSTVDLSPNRERQGNSGKRNGASVPAPEDPGLKQDQVWLSDSEDVLFSNHETVLLRGSRPEHLDFFRITPVEDGSYVDTQYYSHQELDAWGAGRLHSYETQHCSLLSSEGRQIYTAALTESARQPQRRLVV